jgi:hypothetical protein
MKEDIGELKLRIINAGYKAVKHLIKVAEEDIISTDVEGLSVDLAADKMKNAAAAKKLAIFDAFEILNRIEAEKENLDSASNGLSKTDTKQGFAERRSKQ